MTLHLVCDISGSMGEDGKAFTMRTVVMTVAQWTRLKYGNTDTILYAWSSEATQRADWSVEDEFPPDMLVCKGTSNARALLQRLDSEPNGNILILTDGFWERDEIKTLSNWLHRLPPDTLRVIQVGADANPHLLKNLKGVKVFPAEEVFAALDGWESASEEWA